MVAFLLPAEPSFGLRRYYSNKHVKHVTHIPAECITFQHPLSWTSCTEKHATLRTGKDLILISNAKGQDMFYNADLLQAKVDILEWAHLNKKAGI